MLTQRQLKEIFTRYDFAPLKRFGENYLIDGNIKDKIVAEADPGSGDVILEIGPGLGALTFDLASSGAEVYAVEKDPKAYRILRELCGDEFENLHIIHDDILEFDLMRIPSTKKIKIVGNLPYYITTPIVEFLFKYKDRIDSALIVIQREVANRFLAKPGTKEYGSVSCFVQYHTTPAYLHTVKRTSFYPVPDVDSALLRLDMRPQPPVAVKDEELFFKIVRGAFNQRRKTILNSLARPEVLDLPKDDLAALCVRARVDPSARPETLGLADFARIADADRGMHGS